MDELFRRIYEAAGYRLIKSEPHRSFGHDLIGETLGAAAGAGQEE